MEIKKTPLYDEHVKLGGKIVEYAGWQLPIQYSGLVEEHQAVRNKAGLFDVSHMGEITVKGKDSIAFLDYICTNKISSLKDNQVIYTFFCNPKGGTVDDLLVYRYNEEDLYLVVNAANTQKDYDWIMEHVEAYDVQVENISPQVALLALQGPLAEEVLQKLTKYPLKDIGFFKFEDNVDVNGIQCMISRTGYTGEDGFEIYTSNEGIIKVWNDLLEVGKEEGLLPAGLGCRDTLRFEASLGLYGQEVSDDITPLEAGFKFFVKLDKESDFIGKEALTKQWEEGLERKLVGFEMIDRGIPRAGYEIQKDGEKIGHVTTGYLSPSLKKNIGNALIKTEFTELDTEIDVIIRNKVVKAKVRSKKFLEK